jgi:uncharacterized protein YndB with AHSA1/START domain
MLKKLAVLLTLTLIAFGVMMATTGQSVFSVEDSIIIEAPLEQTWDLLAAISAWPQWWPGVESARVIPRLQAGARFELILRGDADAPPATIESLVRHKQLSWIRDGVLGSSTRTALQLTAHQRGAEVTLSSVIRGPQAFLARLTGRQNFESYHRQVLEAMRDRLVTVDVDGAR